VLRTHLRDLEAFLAHLQRSHLTVILKEKVTPYGAESGSKKVQVTQMFDTIAPTYDRLNRVLSLGIDIWWRRYAVRLLKPAKPQIIVDLATGTGDFAIELAKLHPSRIIGIDVSDGMLAVGRDKMKARKLQNLIEMRLGDAENLPLETNSVDAITVGFGVRNFEDLPKGLDEMLRILKPGGVAVILEPGYPTRFPLKQLFNFYFHSVLPVIGKLISADKAAYEYLPQSVSAFPAGKDFTDICKQVGFEEAIYKPLTFGICALYWLRKSS
jgi:demethylmenaquinone methyltransferase / 2-methoxy-6-polyprenyl-1,4-benzoquinol methylase